jgi:hypothetical protein
VPIKACDKREWAGAGSKLLPPISSGDCGNSPDFNDLVLHESKPGRGVVVRAGMAFAKRSPDEIGVMCGLGEPVVNTVHPGSSRWSQPKEVYGSGFGSVGYKVCISRGSAWSDPDEKFECEWNPLYWQAGYVVAVLPSPCQGTGTWYLYVENEAQLVNAAGQSFNIYSCA